MLHCNVWAEVVFCKMEMFTQILLCLFSARHQTLSPTKFQMLVYSGY